MPIGWIAAGIAAVGVGGSLYSMATAPGAPPPPNTAAASREAALAEAQTLPERRALESAAQQGGQTTYTVGAHNEQQQFVQIPTGTKQSGDGQVFKQFTTVPYNQADFQQGGKYYGQNLKIITKNVHVPAGTQTADFTGYGEADVQGAVAQQNAASQLALRQKYDPAFIAEALKQEQEADPQGTAARQKEYDLIQQEQGQTPDRPVAALLDKQVEDQLAAGKNLDGISDDVLKQAVAQAQSDRGGPATNPEQFAEPLTTGFAGQQRLQAGQGKAQSWLQSGATPEDVEYRRQQQEMANEAAFASGQTPESQFAALSGSQQGPTPFTTGQPLPGQSANVGPAANQAAMSSWQTGLGYQLTQANPWMAGLSTLLSGAKVAGAAGYQPLSATVAAGG
jgi:hypothetical protein